MDAGSAMSGSMSRGDEKTEWWASPVVFGLMAFGLTTIIAGLSELPAPYGKGFSGFWALTTLAVILGGIGELIAGFIAYRKGHAFAGVTFLGYGTFWISFVGIMTVFPAQVTAIGGVAAFGVAGFAFVWTLFTLTLFINSLKHGWGMFFWFLFLIISMILLIVQFWTLGGGHTVSNGEYWATGIMWILTGLTAWFIATSRLTNETYGRKLLPL